MVGLMLLPNQSITNENTTEDLTHCLEFSASTKVFFIVAYTPVFLVGLLLNGFIVKFVFCHRQKSSRSIMVYLKNLVAADFLLSLSVPFYIINAATNSTTIRLIYCIFGSIMFYFNMYTSILFMVHIAYNRYVKLHHLVQTRSWPAGALSPANTWGKNLTSVPGRCEDLQNAQFGVFDKVFDTCVLTIFLSILAFIIFIYYRISYKVSMVQQSQVTSSSSKKLAESRRNMLVLVSVFCICFVPFQLVNIPYVFLGCSWSPVLNFLQELTRTLSAVNICLDPFIYFMFCKDFREQMKLKNVFFLRRDTPELNMERGLQNEAELSIQSSSDSS
ncbi:P2Y purinoceptor 14-like [Sphaeramia orbicularis]|uniref:P2Y purinoceptor 14-like n=1 Tax=Sphaeramia orbicularis TaxID=375764 RepID=UPI00117EE66F|nr:P2Y purinoceptor 14-like [Sphaeramia orbicularis]